MCEAAARGQERPLVTEDTEAARSAAGTGRQIFDYELEAPNESNLGRYTTESLVFSFVLLGSIGSMISGTYSAD